MAGENKKILFPQLRYAYGNSFFARPSETTERFGYATHTIQGTLVYPYGKAFSGFISLGGRFAHADKTSLGSRRFLLGLEGGARGFIPVTFLNLFALEAGVSAGLGYSSLNFGGGDNPKGSFDNQIGVLGRILFQIGGFDLGVGIIYGASLTRDYAELGFLAFFSVPLGSSAPTEKKPVETRPDEDCFQLAFLEKEVAEELGPANQALAGARVLYREIQQRIGENTNVYNLQLARKKYLEGNHFKCPDIPLVEEITPEFVYDLPEKPDWKDCHTGLPLMKRYLANLKEGHKKLVASEGIKETLEIQLARARFNHSKIDNWDLECIASHPGDKTSIKIVKTEKGTYRLLTDFLFANDNPDLSLVSQKNLGEDAGFTEPYLDEWIRYLKQNKNFKVTIDGYASDNTSDTNWTEQNMTDLSWERAENVSWYLQNRGKKNAIYRYANGRYSQSKKRRGASVPVSGPFISLELNSPLDKNQMLPGGVRGHNRSDLLKLVEERYGRLNDAGFRFRTSTDPTFRMVRITVWREKNGMLFPVYLEGKEEIHVTK